MNVLFDQAMKQSQAELRLRVTDQGYHPIEPPGEIRAQYDRYDDGKNRVAIRPNTSLALGRVNSLVGTYDSVWLWFHCFESTDQTFLLILEVLVNGTVVATEEKQFVVKAGVWDTSIDVGYEC